MKTKHSMREGAENGAKKTVKPILSLRFSAFSF